MAEAATIPAEPQVDCHSRRVFPFHNLYRFLLSQPQETPAALAAVMQPTVVEAHKYEHCLSIYRVWFAPWIMNLARLHVLFAMSLCAPAVSWKRVQSPEHARPPPWILSRWTWRLPI